MSSLKKILKKKIHKERSQPKKRQKYGLLEKKKDYLLRARDFQNKKKQLKKLKEKAFLKNEEEFYYRMITEVKVIIKKKLLLFIYIFIFLKPDEKLSKEQLLLLKTQDINYLTLKTITENKVII